MKSRLKRLLKGKVKKDIMDYLSTENGAYYGDLVMNMDENQLTILEHLIELKKMGLIYKDTEGGRFRINEAYQNEKDAEKEKKRRKKKTSSKTSKKKKSKESDPSLIEEMNDFSEKMRERVQKKENEIALNKQAPKEQKVSEQKKKKK